MALMLKLQCRHSVDNSVTSVARQAKEIGMCGFRRTIEHGIPTASTRINSFADLPACDLVLPFGIEQTHKH